MKVANISTLTIAHTFVAGAPFSAYLPVGFDPDIVILRQISYGSCTSDNVQSVIQTDLVQYGHGIIGHVVANTTDQIAISSTPNAKFCVNKGKINAGQAKFSILSLNGTALSQNLVADGTLFLNLEFIKF
jgi:hypothetical protein